MSRQTAVWANNVNFYERERAACGGWSGGVCSPAPHNNLGLELMQQGLYARAIAVLEEGTPHLELSPARAEPTKKTTHPI